MSGRPPDANTATLTNTWFANEWLWAGLVPPYKGVWYAGGVKVGWWRSVAGQLAITGKRLDAPAPPLHADIPDGYGPSGFQSTGIDFPAEGCWEVTGTVADKVLRFVVLAHPAAENPMRSVPTLTPAAQPTSTVRATNVPTINGSSDLQEQAPQPAYFSSKRRAEGVATTQRGFGGG